MQVQERCGLITAETGQRTGSSRLGPCATDGRARSSPTTWAARRTAIPWGTTRGSGSWRSPCARRLGSPWRRRSKDIPPAGQEPVRASAGQPQEGRASPRRNLHVLQETLRRERRHAHKRRPLHGGGEERDPCRDREGAVSPERYDVLRSPRIISRRSC